jgi:hypothetical protein
MKNQDDRDFFAELDREFYAERDADYSMKPEQAAKVVARYPNDTPEGYEKIKPEEFFDGA